MNVCRICGEKKDPKEFYRVKHFYRFHHSNVIWCRKCQKLYVEMKKQEEIQKQIEATRGNFCVQFN